MEERVENINPWYKKQLNLFWVIVVWLTFKDFLYYDPSTSDTTLQPKYIPYYFTKHSS